MNLEQRVQMLEEEVQLLKNQIQTTLLAIQEHILSNTYPSLRGEDTATSQMDHAPEATHAHPPKPPENLRGVNRISLDTVDQPDSETPVKKPVSSPIPPQELVEPSVAAHRMSKPSEPEPIRQNTQIDWASLNKMDEWVCRKIDKIGLHRTHRLIEFYAQTNRFSENVITTLLQLIKLYEEDIDPADEARYYNQPFSPDDTITNFDPPIRTYYAESAAPLQDSREVSAHHVDHDLNFEGNGNNNGHIEREQPDAPRKMILKLIAGLQNAGMDWKNPNG